MVIPKEDAKKEGRAMKENLIIALEASWENDPVRMEDIWERMDKDPDEKTYRTKPEQKEKA